jgi:hypothetical protein
VNATSFLFMEKNVNNILNHITGTIFVQLSPARTYQIDEMYVILQVKLKRVLSYISFQ